MKILAIGAHPDDIEIHVGGTLAKYVRMGNVVQGIILTQSTPERQEETIKAFEILGIEPLIHGSLSPKDLSNAREMVRWLDQILNQQNPDMIFTHHHGDSHHEHRTAHQITMSACRHINPTILTYIPYLSEGATHVKFNPQWFEALTPADLDKKQRAFREHKSQYPQKWEKVIDGLAKFYGYRAKHDIAEAFEVVRIVRHL